MRLKRGPLLMVSSCFFFAAMAATIRKLKIENENISCYTVSMVRFFIGNLVVLGAFATGVRKMQWTNWRWIVARGTSGGIAVILFFWAIGALGLAKGVLYSYTYPIFAAILAAPLLGERLSAAQWVSICMAVLGIAFLTGMTDLTFTVRDLGGLGVGLSSGIAVVCLTKCRETDTSTNIFWSQCLFGMAMAAWPMWTHWVCPTGRETAILVVIGLLAVGGQLTMTNAYKFTGATYGSLISLLTPILAALFAVQFFGERLSWRFCVGAALILIPCAHLSAKPVRRQG